MGWPWPVFSPALYKQWRERWRARRERKRREAREGAVLDRREMERERELEREREVALEGASRRREGG